MVAAATILIGAGVGVLASTVNPFATGVASEAAGISIGDGIAFRFLMYVVLVPLSILFVLRYAKKVKADPDNALVWRTSPRRLNNCSSGMRSTMNVRSSIGRNWRWPRGLSAASRLPHRSRKRPSRSSPKSSRGRISISRRARSSVHAR